MEDYKKDNSLNRNFKRNILTLISGTAIAQAIPILISPIVTRLYTPDDFGVFAIFASTTAILSSINTGMYEHAIMLPKSDRDSFNIFILGLMINLFYTVILYLGVSVVLTFFNMEMSIRNIEEWILFLIPISVFLIGVFKLLNYLASRLQLYKILSKANVYKSIGMGLSQIVLGLFGAGSKGLVLSQMLSQTISLSTLSREIRARFSFKDISIRKISVLAKRYIDFPKYYLLSILLSISSLQLFPILLLLFFDNYVIGLFYFAFKLLNMPINIISNSIGQVLFQEISKDRKKISNYILSLVKKLSLYAFIPLIVALLYSPDIFGVVFGDKWERAGGFVQLITPWLFLVFILSPLGVVISVLEKQKAKLYFDSTMLVARVIVALIGGYIFEDVYMTIYLFSLISSIIWLIWGGYILKIAGIEVKLYWKILAILALIITYNFIKFNILH